MCLFLWIPVWCRCIASAATGRGVFDGNVRVGQAAQKTDAQQLSRNLLLVPRATVNVKPNLQIIADDVKCSHGCAVSDLEEDQMFYFRWADYISLFMPCLQLDHAHFTSFMSVTQISPTKQSFGSFVASA